MRILSLFDGMACGAIAFQELGIDIDSYDAYEIDKYAIKTASHNFPIIEEHGDVFAEDFTKYEGKIDWIVGGSPCTYWSIAQTKNRETVASGIGWELFSQYVRALHQAKPKYFLYENNKSMSKEIRKSITETFGFEPICINSALVSAQNRQRLYWVGIRRNNGTYRKAKIEQPDDMGILLKDILETSNNSLSEKEMDYMVRNEDDPQRRLHFVNNPAGENKSHTVTASFARGIPYNTIASPVEEPICVNSKSGRGGVEGVQPSLQDRIYDVGGKMTAVTTSFNPNIAEPIRIVNYELESVKNKDEGVIGMLDMPKNHDLVKRVYGENGKAPTVNTCSGGNRETKIFAEVPECFVVKEATKTGYVEIFRGGVRRSIDAKLKDKEGKKHDREI